MNVALLVSAWLAGALGGAHCAAMCGGLVTAVATRDASREARPTGVGSLLRRQAPYHAGRVATYALLGGALGAAGGGALALADVAWLQRGAYVAADLLLIMLGASLVVRMPPVAALQRAGAAAFAPLVRHAAPLLRAPGAGGRFALGLAWGLMPCALVYAVLPLALLAGGGPQGAGVMLAFGVGTLPNLIGGGVLLARLRRSFPTNALRFAGATVMIAFGVLGLARAALPGLFSAMPFCLVS